MAGHGLFGTIRKVIGPLSASRTVWWEYCNRFIRCNYTIPYQGMDFQHHLEETGINFWKTSDLWVQTYDGFFRV